MYYIASIDIVILGVILLMASILFTYLWSPFDDQPKLSDIWTSILINIQVILLVPTNFYPNRGTIRCIFATALLASLATTTTFLAFYYNFILQPRYEKQIDTFAQLVNNHFLLAGSMKTKDYLVQQNLVNTEIR